MYLHGAGRSGHRRLAHLVLALAVVACRKHETPRPLDAAPADAVPLDAPAEIADAAGPPAPVATKLVASGDSTCAVMSDLTVRCWGGNAHGQLGDGTTGDAETPVRPEIRAVKDLQLVDGTACALLDDASVACWGRIGWHGHAEDVLRPAGVLGVIGVKQIFVVGGRACARVANDSLVCWGNVDARGHFARGPTNRAPTPVVGLDHVAGLLADGAFSDDGRLWSWARDGVPKRIDVASVQEIGDRDGTVCGRLQNGRVMCAPSTRCGPRPTPAPKPQPAPAKPAVATPTKTATSVVTTPSKNAKPTATPSKTGKPAATTTSKTAKPGSATASKTAKPTTTTASKTAKPATTASKTAKPGSTTASKTAKPTTASETTKLAAAKPGNPPNQPPSGAATSPSPSAPVGEAPDVLGFPAARQLAFDLGFCVVTTAGKLVCGDGCRQIDPPKLERVDAVIGRCALLTSGSVTCFDGSKATVVPGITRASGLAVGAAHACALVAGRIVCWGSDDHHQLGGFAMTQ
jgi:hypothetical protein